MMAPWWSPIRQVPEISAGKLHERLTHGAKIQLLDVRTRRKFAHGHITGAVNVPIQSFGRGIAAPNPDHSRCLARMTSNATPG
jgi:rhodanese-related sulfurtransferase